MSKQILIISSSPRKNGNSDTLCNEFAKGATNAGHKVEKIFLKDKTINYCTGCGHCVHHKGSCTQHDDMGIIKEKMVSAQIIVLATPIYFYTMCGQMKTFIDRNCFFYTELTQKEFYFIMTAADENKSAMDNTISEFRGYIQCLSQSTIKNMIIATNVWNVGDIAKSSILAEAFNMGASI